MPWIVLGIVIVLAAVGLWYVVGQGNGADENANIAVVNTNTTGNQNVSIVNINATVDTSGWVTHTNTQLGFTIKHPQNWTARIVGSEPELNQQEADSVLSEGQCAEGEVCEISEGYCTITIGQLPYPFTSEKNIDLVLDDLRTRARSPIVEVTFPNFSGYVTDTAASPPDENGDQLLGKYYLLQLNNQVLHAILGTGYLREDCRNALHDILSTFSTDLVVGFDAGDLVTYINQEHQYSFQYPPTLTVQDYTSLSLSDNDKLVSRILVPVAEGDYFIEVTKYSGTLDEVKEALRNRTANAIWLPGTLDMQEAEYTRRSYNLDESFFEYIYLVSREKYVFVVSVFDQSILNTFHFL